jgi:hypothetical protein
MPLEFAYVGSRPTHAYPKDKMTKYFCEVLEAILPTINRWTTFTAVLLRESVPPLLPMSIPFAKADRLERVKICYRYMHRVDLDQVEWLLALVGTSPSSTRRLDWECPGGIEPGRQIEVPSAFWSQLESLTMDNHLTWRNNLSLIETCASLVVLGVTSMGEPDLNGPELPIVRLPKLRALHLRFRCSSRAVAVMSKLACPELQVLCLEVRY